MAGTVRNALSTNEREFLLGSLRENPPQRLDGRKPYDFRAIKITFGRDPGHAEVQLGNTRVIARVSCEIVQPLSQSATEGFFTFNIELSPMADTSFESARSSTFAVELGRIVERGLRESKAIDAEALCIVAGEKVWSIRCDIHIVDNGGNLIDCASIATVTALLHFRRPATTIIGKSVTVHSPQEREPVPLSIHHIPVSVTFGLFDEGQVILVDPSLKEEEVMDSRMTFTLNAHREICAAQKAGGVPLSLETILNCSRIAAVKVEEITEIITSSLKHKNQASYDKLSETLSPAKKAGTQVQTKRKKQPAQKEKKKPKDSEEEEEEENDEKMLNEKEESMEMDQGENIEDENEVNMEEEEEEEVRAPKSKKGAGKTPPPGKKSPKKGPKKGKKP